MLGFSTDFTGSRHPSEEVRLVVSLLGDGGRDLDLPVLAPR